MGRGTEPSGGIFGGCACVRARFYAWWQTPGALPGVPGTAHPSAELELLYVGIAPKDAVSKSNLRKRLATHHRAAIGSYTFRLDLTGLPLGGLRLAAPLDRPPEADRREPRSARRVATPAPLRSVAPSTGAVAARIPRRRGDEAAAEPGSQRRPPLPPRDQVGPRSAPSHSADAPRLRDGGPAFIACRASRPRHRHLSKCAASRARAAREPAAM